VILDWAAVHFPRDEHGFLEYDGAPLFESPGPYARERREWGSRRFDYGKPEVKSFLISSAIYWLERFHADGLRIYGVSAILYPDHAKRQRDWTANTSSGVEDPDGIALLQELNKMLNIHFPGALRIAEETTGWPMVTKPVHGGGLGFHFKWNTSWMRDMMEYVSVDPIHRKMVHHKITSSFHYAFSERFILPLPHNEVASGKGSIMDRMPGEYEWKFAGARAFLAYMIAHPGKKLQFMGSEIGQFREWDYHAGIEWFLLDFPAHKKLKEYVRLLNLFYLDTPALWEIDEDWDGFQWICADDNTQNIAIFIRWDKNKNPLVTLANFAPVTRNGYCFGVPYEGRYEEAFSSDLVEFGGQGTENGILDAREAPMHGFPFQLQVTVPPMSVVFFRSLDGPPAEAQQTETPEEDFPESNLKEE